MNEPQLIHGDGSMELLHGATPLTSLILNKHTSCKVHVKYM